jgi:hypothetical protein
MRSVHLVSARFVENAVIEELLSSRQVPLRLYLLTHPQSQSARLLAQELMRRFVDPPASGGLRLPVFFTPDRGNDLPPAWDGEVGIELDASDHTLVVVLADARMAQEVNGGTGEQWAEFLEEGITRANASAGRHLVFGIAVGSGGYLISDQRHMVGVPEAVELPLQSARTDEEKRTQAEQRQRYQEWLGRTADSIALQIAIRAIPLLEPQAATAGPGRRPPVKLFLSHAKADLGLADASAEEADPVRNVELAVKELPIQYWFDAQDIPPAERFEEEIRQGLQDCSIVVVFLSDQYASRPYCQMEVLVAKRLEVPLLVVNALENGERRNFPYLGNVPTIHWNGRDRKATALRIVFQAIRETLRYVHNRASLAALWSATPNASANDVILATPPEAITLSRYPALASGRQVFVYPDPPLAQAEREVLASLRDADFVTPLMQLTRSQRPGSVKTIAVSISDSAELAKYGLCLLHEQTLTDEIHLSLLMAGLQIAYGGRLDPPAAGPTNNFTLRLFDLVRGYSRLAADAGAKLAPILNIPPWPLWLSYNDKILKLFGKTAKLTKGVRPPLVEIPDLDGAGAPLFPPDGNPFSLPDTALRRLAWTRGLTLMRQQMTHETQARLVIGGKLLGFSGLSPGVVEEAWLSLVAKRPLFLVGCLGGAARAVIDLLEGRDRIEVREPDLGTTAPPIAEILELARQRGLTVIGPDDDLPDPLNLTGKLISPTRLAADIQRAGQHGRAIALNNGLSDEENQELFGTLHPPRIAELILTGLSRRGIPANS